MQQAICKLNPAPDMLLVDAVTIPEVTTKQVGIVKGDAKSVSIAEASILAKVTRDRMMVELDEAYPEYGFAQHKGYGSAAHKKPPCCYASVLLCFLLYKLLYKTLPMDRTWSVFF